MGNKANKANKSKESENNIFNSKLNKELNHLLNENIKLLSLILSLYSGKINQTAINKIRESFAYHNIIDENVIKSEIEYNDKIVINLLKKLSKNIKEKLNDKNLNKVYDILNSLLKEENENIKNEFIFLCKLNLIKLEADEEYKYFLDTNIKIKNQNEEKFNIINEINKNEKQDNNSNIIESYSVWNDSQKMEKLFHHKSIKYLHSLTQIKEIKVINNKVILIDDKCIKFFDVNNNMSLILKVKIGVKGPLLILKNKNYIIGSNCDKYLFLFDKNKLNIIDKIVLFTQYNNYKYNYNIINEKRIVELFDQSIAYINEIGIAIYKKIKNKYIFYKFIISQKSSILPFNNTCFIIKNKHGISKYSIKDYSIIQALNDIIDCKSLTKIDKNTIILHNGKNKNSFGELYFLDINSFQIIFKKEVKGTFTNIISLKKNKFLITTYRNFPNSKREINKLSLYKLVKNKNQYEFINEYNIILKSKINLIFPLETGNILFINDSNQLKELCYNNDDIKTMNDEYEQESETEEEIEKEIEDDNKEYDLFFKILLVGDTKVGKSSILKKVIKNKFNEKYHQTIGIEYFLYNIEFNGYKIKFQIWDASGDKIYRSLLNHFYENSSLIILTYDITSKETFDNLDSWIPDINNKRFFLLGNKIDLENERKILKDEGEKFKKGNKFDLFLETSAKTGINFNNIFEEAAKILCEDFLK